MTENKIAEWVPKFPAFYIEGIDGAGKTTQARMLVERLNRQGLPTSLHRRPGTNPAGQIVRESTFHKDNIIPESARALLLAADQVMVNQEIMASIRSGSATVCDRSSLSTFVYQEAKGCERRWLKNFIPRDYGLSALFYLDVSVETAMSRLNERGELSEFETAEFLSQARDLYETHCNKERFIHRLHVIDASSTAEETVSTIEKIVLDLWAKAYE